MHPTWTDQLPEALRTEENYAIFDKYEKLGDFTADFLSVNGNLSELTGERDELKGSVTKLEESMKGMIAIPSEDSSEEERASFFKALGVPESIEEYGFEELTKDETGKATLSALKEANLNKSQAEKVLTFLSSHYENTQKAQKEAQAEAVKAYKEKLGAEKSKVVFKNAEDAIEKFFAKEDREEAKASIMSNPKMISVYSEIGSLLRERPAIFAAVGADEGSGDFYPSMSAKGIH